MAMRDHRTEVIDPYEPAEDPAYEWEYDDEPAYRGTPRVLWGRLVALGVFLLLAFLLGRATAGGGIPQEEFDALRADLNDTRAEVASMETALQQAEDQSAALQEQLTAAQADQGTTGETAGTTGADTGGDEPTGETYVIKEGDTLRDIALEFYGDATLDDYIAEANDIVDPSVISTGTEITIPPDPNP